MERAALPQAYHGNGQIYKEDKEGGVVLEITMPWP